MDPRRRKREKREKDKIVVYSKRPNRKTQINDEDIVNLRIALWSTDSVNEFFNFIEKED